MERKDFLMNTIGLIDGGALTTFTNAVSDLANETVSLGDDISNGYSGYHTIGLTL